MNTIKEKASYLRGLAEGMKISDTTNEGKLLLAIIDVLDDIAFEMEDSQEYLDEIDEKVAEIDEAVGDLEEIIYGDDEEGCDCGCGCDDCDCDHEHEGMQYITIECPHCKKQTSFDVDIFDEETESVECPHCHEKIEVTYDDCDCGCDCE